MATNGKKTQVPPGLPRIPARVKMDDPLDIRKTMFGLNCSRDGLEYQTKQLAKGLEQYKGQLSKVNLRKFTQSLKAMRKASKLIADIDCAGPYMSFEFSYLNREQKPAKARARRKS